ncbi:MAG: hypothetical protein ACFB0C_15810 [Leptolyngbyaceae cyanobacterium]
MRKQTQARKYSFQSQESIGKSGEKILDEWLKLNYKILDVSDISKYQKSGIDRILMRPDGTMVNVEYKFDIASSRTGNLFFETVSVDSRNIPGWGWRSQADYWIFLLPSMEILVVEPGKLRNLVWQERLAIEDKTVRNSNYRTLGIPVPLPRAREIAVHITKLA